MEYLIHYNTNHDKMGRFTFSKGASYALDPTIKGGKNNPNRSPTEVITRETGKAVNGAKDTVRAGHKLKKISSNQDLSKMSDDELRRAINRKNLERQYRDITDEETSKGYARTMQVLEVIGGVTTIAAAGATIATTVYTIKKGL